MGSAQSREEGIVSVPTAGASTPLEHISAADLLQQLEALKQVGHHDSCNAHLRSGASGWSALTPHVCMLPAPPAVPTASRPQPLAPSDGLQLA